MLRNKLRTNLIIYEVKPYFIHPNPDNLPIPEHFLKSNNISLQDELTRISDGHFNRIVLAETRPTSAEETKFVLPVMQQAFQHKLGNNVEVVFDPFWHSISAEADSLIKKIPAGVYGKPATPNKIEEEKIRQTMEQYGISNTLATVHRVSAQLPIDDIHLQIFNTRTMQENAAISQFFIKYPKALPNNVAEVKLAGPDATGKEIFQTAPEKPIAGISKPSEKLDHQIKLTTAKAWHGQQKIAENLLFDEALTAKCLPVEMKVAPQQPLAQVTVAPPVVAAPAPIPDAQPQIAITPLATILTGSMKTQRNNILEDYKNGKTTKFTIEAYLRASVKTEEPEGLTDQHILNMIHAIATAPEAHWDEKGKGSWYPTQFWTRHVPDSVNDISIANPASLDLLNLRKKLQPKLEDRVATAARSDTTQQFYELIVALSKFKSNNTRDVGIRAFCYRFNINYTDIAHKAGVPTQHRAAM